MWTAFLSLVEGPGLPERALPGGLDLTRYLLVCAVLIVAIAAAGWAVRRWLGGAMRVRASRRSLEVLDVLPLGGKHRLGVVRCNERSFLLGFGDREISLITELDAAPDPAAAGLSEQQRRIFAAALQRAAQHDDVRPATRAPGARSAPGGAGRTGTRPGVLA